MKQRSRRLKRQILSSLSIFFLYMFQISGCSFNPNSDIILGLNNKNSFELIPVKFDELPGWNGDKHAEALKTFLISCLRIEKLDTSSYIGPYKEMGRVSQWIKICRSANKIREPPENINKLSFLSTSDNIRKIEYQHRDLTKVQDR